MFTMIFQLDALDQEAWEVILSIRSMRNKRAPVNRLPYDVLALIPNFLDGLGRGKVAITLTHVCRAWRETFISRPSLWTDFYCSDAEKTRVYLERSKSVPINVWLEREQGLLPNDPFLGIPSHAIARLKFLRVKTTPDQLEDITKHLVHPTPLLKTLTIDAGAAPNHQGPTPVLTSALCGGDLSSLRGLCLHSVCTQLPWRNMNNLMFLTLAFLPQSTVSLGQVLDFLESAPRLWRVTLTSATPTLEVQDGRLVSLSHLRKLQISGPQPPFLLLNHLVIPAGAEVTITSNSRSPQIDDLFPRSFDNFQNLPNFNRIQFQFAPYETSMRFSGPNGGFCVESRPEPDPTRSIVNALERFDTLSTQFLVIEDDDTITDEIHEAIWSMTDLCTLHIYRCNDSPSFLLDPYLALASDGEVAWPKLEELTYHVPGVFDVGVLVDYVAARASRGVPLKSIKVISARKPVPTEEVAELREHVSHVEICFEGNEDDYLEDTDEDDDEGGWMDL